MTLGILEIDHVQLTVPDELELEAKGFYGQTLGLKEVPKPAELRKRGGAWYQVGAVQLHLSLEGLSVQANQTSRRHVCFVVNDLQAVEASLRGAGVEIIPDQQPTQDWIRFYVRDPGGNRLEIAQRVGAP